MARKQGESMQVLNPSSEPPDVDMSEMVTAAEVIGDATSKSKPTVEEIQIPKYRVLNGGRIKGTCGSTHIAPGKIVDPLNYDIDLLKQQGIKLELVD